MAAKIVHDLYRLLPSDAGTILSQNLAVATSGGVANSTSSMASETYFLRLTCYGTVSSTGGVRYMVNDAPVGTRHRHFFPSTGWKLSSAPPAKECRSSAMTPLRRL